MKPGLLPPVVGYLLSGLTMFALRFVALGPRWLRPPLAWAGLALVLVGMALTSAACRCFEEHAVSVVTACRPEFLVTDGPYRWSRNPMYLGMLVSLLGMAVFFGMVLPLIVLAVFGAWLHVCVVRPEERALEGRFGEEHRAWRRRVRRWL